MSINNFATLLNVWIERKETIKKIKYNTFMNWFDENFLYKEKFDEIEYTKDLINIDIVKGYLGKKVNKLSLDERQLLFKILAKLKD